MFWTLRTLALALLGLPVVVLVPSGWTVTLWIAAVVALAMVDVIFAPAPKAVEASRDSGTSIRFGEQTTSTVTLVNTGRRMRLRVRDVWQPLAGAESAPTAVKLEAFGSATVTTTLTPRRRGTVRTHRFVIRSRGVLGLGGRQRSIEVPGSVTVLPAFPSRRALPSKLVLLRELDGRSAVRTRGHGTEFDALREYVRGDDVRSIDWRASARSKDLVVRTWQPERDRHVVIVLDTGRLSAGRVEGIPRLDTGMDAALLMAAIAAKAGDRVHFVAVDREIRAEMNPVAQRIVGELSDAMAPIEPSLDVTDWGALMTHLRRDALVVLITPLEAEATTEDLLPFVSVIALKYRVVVASVTDPALAELAADGRVDEVDADGLGDIDRLQAMAAAETTRSADAAATDALIRAGATVIQAPPKELGTRLVDHYLWLKREGRL